MILDDKTPEVVKINPFDPPELPPEKVKDRGNIALLCQGIAFIIFYSDVMGGTSDAPNALATFMAFIMGFLTWAIVNWLFGVFCIHADEWNNLYYS